MQPLSLLLSGLFISSLCSTSDSSADFSVIQTPSRLSVKEGQAVSLQCCWSKNISGVKVKWYKDNYLIQPNQTDERFRSEALNTTCAVFSIRHSCTNDTGLYICGVTQDIPRLVTVEGSGTTVSLEEGGAVTVSVPTPSTSAEFSLVPIVGVSVPCTVILICLCMSLAVWRTCRKTERVVIREGPPSEGEEPENSEGDDSSRNSRGSTQWYMVPVYESYFDLQRNDEEQTSNKEPSAKSDQSDSLESNRPSTYVI